MTQMTPEQHIDLEAGIAAQALIDEFLPLLSEVDSKSEELVYLLIKAGWVQGFAQGIGQATIMLKEARNAQPA